MLILTRKRYESVIIADGMIEIKLLEIRGDRIRLGISAPDDVSVHREEVFDAIQREKEAVSRSEFETKVQDVFPVRMELVDPDDEDDEDDEEESTPLEADDDIGEPVGILQSVGSEVAGMNLNQIARG